MLIIGAGISGLCTAYWLKKAGYTVAVLEKESQVGGTMKTIREHGYLVEIGPNSALETTPLFKELFEGLGLNDELVYANPVGKNRFILRNGTLHPLPLGPVSFLRSSLFSFPAKLRLLKEPFIGRATKEETVSEFVIRRLGQEFLDYAIDPFVAGIFAANPDNLSVRAAFPKLFALEEEYGGLILGMIKGRKARRQRAEKAKDRAASFSFLHGMQVLPERLAHMLGESLLLDARVTMLHDLGRFDEEPADEPDARRYKVDFLHHGVTNELEADAVVLACPAYAAAPLVHSFSLEASRALMAIPYAPVASVFLAFKRSDVPHSMNGFGFLVPGKEKRRLLGCLWSSSLFSGRAPNGEVALTAFVGGSRQPELVGLNDERLLTLVLDELKSIMQIQGKPVYWRPTRWEKAIPQYTPGHLERMEALADFEEQHAGILFCANYRGGIAVGDCVMSAHRAAERIQNFLQSRPER